MAGELVIKLNTTGLTLRACVWGHNRARRWNGSALVASDAIADADWATGMVAMPEQETGDATDTGTYVGDFPAGITAAGEYAVEFYSGESPTPGQAALGRQAVQWAGTGMSQVLPAVSPTTIAVSSVVSGSSITVLRGDTFATSDLTGLGSVADRSKLWFTVKVRGDDDADENALLRIELPGGLMRVNGAFAAAGNGSIVVDDEIDGDFTVTVAAEEMAKLVPYDDRVWDLQVLRTSGVVDTLARGSFDIDEDVTRATA